MRSRDRVRAYFDREAARFDAIYDDARKSGVQRAADRLLRGVVVARWTLVCNLAPCGHAWTALDVGCGSGRYAIEFARRGAVRVAGLDVAPAMIDLARRHAASAGVADRTQFTISSFLDFPEEATYDVVVATGYFDYVEDPVPHLRKMLALCRGRLFVSIPKRWEFRVPTRVVRFALAGGYVRFYSKPEFLRIAGEAGVAAGRLSLIDLGRDWIAVVNCHQATKTAG